MLSELKNILRVDQVVSEGEDLQHYGRDWTRVHSIKPLAIVFPESTKEVQEVVKWAFKNKTPVVPSGGRTGLSGGAVASKKEVVLSLERMKKIIEINPVDRLISVEAGVPTQVVQEELKNRGFYFPVDFASRGSSQIGGNISTNAGGTKVIRYGLMRDWVAGIEVVTGTGELLSLNLSLTKNNAGYDLKQLFIGAEGTLGIITEASLRFTDPPKNLGVFLLSSEKLDAALELMLRFRKLVSLTAFEFFTDKALRHVCRHFKKTPAFSTDVPFYFLVEFEGSNDGQMENIFEALEQMKAEGLIVEADWAGTEEQQKEIWEIREGISESLAPMKPYKNDISVKISKIPEFVSAWDQYLKKSFPKTESVWFGHIGDGNLHINVLRSVDQTEESFKKDCELMSQNLSQILKKFRGSISAEHGIGLLKKPYLESTRSAKEVEIMRNLKKIFDPAGILNPGKVFD